MVEWDPRAWDGDVEREPIRRSDRCVESHDYSKFLLQCPYGSEKKGTAGGTRTHATPLLKPAILRSCA